MSLDTKPIFPDLEQQVPKCIPTLILNVSIPLVCMCVFTGTLPILVLFLP